MNDHLVRDSLLRLRQKEVVEQMLLPIYEWSPRTWWLATYEAKGGCCVNATTYIWTITSYVMACCIWGKRRCSCRRNSWAWGRIRFIPFTCIHGYSTRRWLLCCTWGKRRWLLPWWQSMKTHKMHPWILCIHEYYAPWILCIHEYSTRR